MTNQFYGLVPDSGCDLTADIRDYFDVRRVALTLRVGETEFADDATLDLPAFHRAITQGKAQIRSACPAPGVWADAFVSHPAPVVFCVTLAAKQSGAYASAVQGAELAAERGKRVHVFNSKSATAGELQTALKIREAIEMGLDFDGIVAYVTEFIDKMQTFAVLKNTDGLIKNGRMPNFLGKAVEMLNLKLILYSDGNGVILLRSKARGFDAALEKMVSLWADTCEDFTQRTLVVTHGSNEQAAQRVADLGKETYGFRDCVVLSTGGIGSLYGGVGGVVVAF